MLSYITGLLWRSSTTNKDMSLIFSRSSKPPTRSRARTTGMWRRTRCRCSTCWPPTTYKWRTRRRIRKRRKNIFSKQPPCIRRETRLLCTIRLTCSVAPTPFWSKATKWTKRTPSSTSSFTSHRTTFPRYSVKRVSRTTRTSTVRRWRSIRKHCGRIRAVRPRSDSAWDIVS
uniref:Uncharacterized protein n=1 Tax=Cacopsylla melanoneura TaxID=428564 RepID=A0A8D8TV67_9HEMI